MTGPSFKEKPSDPASRAWSSLPDPVVGPRGGVLGRVALEVHALHGLGALGDQREPAVRACVDQLRRALGCLAQDPEPGERILPVMAMVLGDEVAADAVRAVGADHQVRSDLVDRALRVPIAHPRTVRAVVHRGLGDAVPEVAVVAGAGAVEIDEDLGLWVEPHAGSDQVLEVDAVALAVEPQVDTAVPVALGEYAFLAGVVDAGLGQQSDAVRFEHARTVRGLDLVHRAVVDHDGLDAGPVQKVGEHQPGGAAPHDRHLGTRARRHGGHVAQARPGVSDRSTRFCH